MRFGFKLTRAFRAFSTKTLGDVVKDSVVVLASTALGPPLVATLLGVVSKGLVDTLLEQASRVESKLDRLLREPLVSGLRLLKQALIHGRSSVEERQAGESLLDSAHVSFTRALALAGDSREDSVFIRALDCVALAAYSGHRSIAISELEAIRSDLNLMSSRVRLLEAEAKKQSEFAKKLDRFFRGNGSHWGGKPFGYGEQLIMARREAKVAARLQKRADQAGDTLEVLEGIVRIAADLVDATAEGVPLET